jgi:hypothetical protein
MSMATDARIAAAPAIIDVDKAKQDVKTARL